jgi:hypothetical protein
MILTCISLERWCDVLLHRTAVGAKMRKAATVGKGIFGGKKTHLLATTRTIRSNMNLKRHRNKIKAAKSYHREPRYRGFRA